MVTMSSIKAENAELKRKLSELENFATLLCSDVFDMMIEIECLDPTIRKLVNSNYSGVLDTIVRGRDGDFND